MFKVDLSGFVFLSIYQEVDARFVGRFFHFVRAASLGNIQIKKVKVISHFMTKNNW